MPDTSQAAPSPAKPLRPAKHYAGYLLGMREWSAKELRQRLALKGYPPQDIEDCMAFLEGAGLQDDARYAQVRARSKSRTLGNRRIRQDLKTKGIADDAAAEALTALEDESSRAVAAAARFEGKPWSLELKAKAWRFLMARGFGSDAIKAAIAQLQSQAG